MPSEPRWLTVEHALRFNQRAVDVTSEPHQLLDLGRLEGALATPANHWHHGETKIGRLAARLLLSVARNHPFVQGNKRTALLLADATIAINGGRLQYPDGGFADLILATIKHEVDDQEFVRRMNEAVVQMRPNIKGPRNHYRSATTGRYTTKKS